MAHPLLLPGLLALGLLVLPGDPPKAPPREPDRPDLRRDAERAWFGGAPGPDYLDAKARQAEAQVRRFPRSFPAPGGAAAAPVAGAPGPGGTWTCLGPRAQLTSAGRPDIDSGRPVAVVPHPTDPKILYLATSGGGVYKSVDADLAAAGDWTWTPLTDGLPASGNLSAGALAMSPADPQVLYLGLGDAFDAEGRGLYRSADGGATWTAAAGLCAATTRVYDILAFDANLVLAGTNAGLMRSTDGGLSFTCWEPFGPGAKVWTLRRIGPAGVLASVQSGSGAGSLWYSTDGANPGLSWAQASLAAPGSPGRITLATSPASATLAWGLCENLTDSTLLKGVLRSSDGGLTWSFVPSPSGSSGLFNTSGPGLSGDGGQSWYNQLLAVDPSDPNRLFAGANLALYRSPDGGASWEQLTHWNGANRVYAHADFHAAAWSRTGPRALYLANDGGLAILRDPDRTPVPSGPSPAADPSFVDNRRNRGLATHLVYNLGSTQAADAPDARNRISLGLQDNGTRIRQGSGAALATSAVFEDQIGGDGFGTLWHPTQAARVLGSLYYTRIYGSSDGGDTFFEATGGLTGAGDSSSAPFFTKLASGVRNQPDTVFTFTNTTVFRSTAFGGGWTPLSTPESLPLGGRVIRNLGASALNPACVAVVTSGGTGWSTADGGATWTQFGPFPGNALSLSWIGYDPQNEAVLYAASVALSATATHLWRSGDGGATWASLEGAGFPAGIPVHVVQVDPGNARTLFVGTDFGVYASADGGASWSRYGAGLPLVAVRDLWLGPDGTVLRAATYGRGVWELTGTPAALAPSINRQPSDATVYAGERATFVATANGYPAPAYQWTRDGADIPGATGTSYTTAVVGPGDAGAVFRLRATNPSGTDTSAPAVLAVLPSTAPAFTLEPAGLAVQEGEPATFTAAATGLPAPRIQWQRDGVDIPGATGGTFTLPSAGDGDHLAAFRAVAVNVAGSAASAAATLSVSLFPPTLALQPVDAAVFPGATATFLGTASGSGVAYHWLRDGVELPGISTNSLAVGPVTLADQGSRFVLVAENRAGTVQSREALLTVLAPLEAPRITSQPGDAAVVEGQTATFRVQATGNPPPAYSWRRDGAVIPGAASALYTTPPATLADDGAVYTVFATNSQGGVLSGPARLTVTAAPRPPSILAFTATPAAVLPGGTSTLAWSVSGAETVSLAGVGPVSGTSLPVTPAATTTYTLTAANGAGSATASVTVAVRGRDLDGDGAVADVLDLAYLARAWSGPGVPTAFPAADLDGDGDCDDDDAALFLAGF